MSKSHFSMTYAIRPATLQDLDPLKKLETSLINFERTFDEDIRPGDDVVYYDLAAKIKNSNESVVFVAEVEQQIVGCGMGTIKNFENWAKGDHYGMINFIYTHKTCRGQGVASSILEALKNWFTEKNITNIQLKVYCENEGAIKAYQKNNFKAFTQTMKLKL